MDKLPVAVIGAGPVGLAAAAELLMRGAVPLVLEAGPTVGASVLEWGHVRIFSPWKYDIDPAARDLLETDGWIAPDGEVYPTGRELVEGYLAPLGTVLAPYIRLRHRVSAVTRLGFDKLKTEGRDGAPFALTVDTPAGEQQLLARAVIDASGTYGMPNPLGASGVLAQGEAALADRIHYGIPDPLGRQRMRYEGKRVLVVGSGHSAFDVLIDLAQLPATPITWLVRRPFADAKYGVGPFDEIVATTGFRPDLAPLREVRVRVDDVLEAPPALAPLIDPNVHSCGTVSPHGARELAHPEKDLYIVGMKSYGRAPTFLMLTGYEQVRSIACALTGDVRGAASVELVLPATGVCSGGSDCCDGVDCGSAASTCCGTSSMQVIPVSALTVARP